MSTDELRSERVSWDEASADDPSLTPAQVEADEREFAWWRRRELVEHRAWREQQCSAYNELAAAIAAATGKPYAVKARNLQWVLVDTGTGMALTTPYTSGIFADLLNALVMVAVQARGYSRAELARERARLGLAPTD